MNINDLLDKIIVDGQEIDLQVLTSLNGNLSLGKQKDVNVEYIFKDDTQIPSEMFKNLKQLKYAYFPKAGNIKTIGEQAFINSNLSYINDLSYINYIGAQAFSYTKLSYVYNGDAPSSIASSAWSYIDTLDNDFKETLRRKYPYIDFGDISYNSGEGGNEGGNEQGNDEIISYNYNIINCDFNNNETLFVQQKDPNGANRTTITNTDNILVLTNASNSSNGNSCAKYDFSNYINENTYKVNIQFDIKLTDQTPLFHNIFTLGDSNLRTQTIKEYNNTGAIFNIGTKRGKWNDTGNTVNYFTINNQYVKYSEQDGYNSLVNNWLLIKVSANLQEKTISYKIVDKSNAQIIYQESNINYIDENANVLNIIDYDSCINNTSNYIDNLIIEKETYAEESQQSGEQTIKQDVTLTYDNPIVNITGNVGDEITLQEVNCSYVNAQIIFTVQSAGVITENNGKYYIAKEGQAIVTANYAGDDTHNPATVQYTINITIANQESGEQGDNQTYVDILNVPFDNQEIYFEKSAGIDGVIRIANIENSNIDGNNVLVFTNSDNANRNGSAVGVYNFNYLLTTFDKLYKIKFDIKLSNGTPQYHNMFTIGDIYYRERAATNYNNNGAIFNIGTRRGKWNGTGTNVNYFTINNQYLKFEQQDGYNKLVNNWLHVEVEINLTNRTLNYLVQTQDLTETLYEAQNVNFVDQVNDVTLNEIDYDSSIGSGINYLDNLIIQKGTNN